MSQNADAFECQVLVGTIKAFGRSCCIIACPIDATGTDFSFPTNKVSNKMRRDLGRYSTFLSDDSFALGEG